MRLFLVGLILLSSSLIYSSFAYANFTGQWYGEGIVTTADGQQIYCDEIIINVLQSSEKIQFGNFRYACGEFAINFTPPELKIIENEEADSADVSWKDQNVGTISSQSARLLFLLANNGKARYTVNRISEKEIDYHDEQIGIDSETGKEKVTSIKAKLNLSNSIQNL